MRGLKRGRVTNSVVESHHVILLQEAKSHFHEIPEIAAEQFHTYQDADQLILYHNNTFELEWREDPGSSNQDSIGLKCLMVRSRFRSTPKNGKDRYTLASVHLSNTTAKRRGVAQTLLGQFRDHAELNHVDIIGSDFNMSAYREGGKETEFN